MKFRDFVNKSNYYFVNKRPLFYTSSFIGKSGLATGFNAALTSKATNDLDPFKLDEVGDKFLERGKEYLICQNDVGRISHCNLLVSSNNLFNYFSCINLRRM